MQAKDGHFYMDYRMFLCGQIDLIYLTKNSDFWNFGFVKIGSPMSTLHIAILIYLRGLTPKINIAVYIMKNDLLLDIRYVKIHCIADATAATVATF